MDGRLVVVFQHMLKTDVEKILLSTVGMQELCTILSKFISVAVFSSVTQKQWMYKSFVRTQNLISARSQKLQIQLVKLKHSKDVIRSNSPSIQIIGSCCLFPLDFFDLKKKSKLTTGRNQDSRSSVLERIWVKGSYLSKPMTTMN